jgi:hypothetical protein
MGRLKLIVIVSLTATTEITRGGPLGGGVGVPETGGALHVRSAAARRKIDRRTGGA